jgi:hypothetical protein
MHLIAMPATVSEDMTFGDLHCHLALVATDLDRRRFL